MAKVLVLQLSYFICNNPWMLGMPMHVFFYPMTFDLEAVTLNLKMFRHLLSPTQVIAVFRG